MEKITVLRKENEKHSLTEVRTITNQVGAEWVVLDVIGGLVPVIVDAATGSWYYLDQKISPLSLRNSSNPFVNNVFLVLWED